MIALIDGDIVVNRVAFTTQKEPDYIARTRQDRLIENILDATNADDYQLWLSDSSENNFRKKLFPLYKANRTLPRPKHYELLKELLIVEWGARIAYGMEADDALGINQCGLLYLSKESNIYPVICTVDKDLLQIPGDHYNFVKDEFTQVLPIEGLKSFYKQILIGDASDNIPGCPKIGQVKASKSIDPCGTEPAMHQKVKDLYITQHKKYYPDMTEEEILGKLLLVARLVRVRQESGEHLFEFPSSEQSIPAS